MYPVRYSWVGKDKSPGLVVMGAKGRGFKSRYRIRVGHFFTYICSKNCNDVFFKRLKINEKEAGVGPFKNSIERLLMQKFEENK